jgi:L-iditol 2-dehydrogenase
MATGTDLMTVARLHGVRDVRVVREPVPVPEPGMSLVRVTAIGLCGSDLHWYTEAGIGDARLDAPLVVGHEFAGVVTGGPLHGQRVAVDPAIPCGACATCRRGHGHLCPDVRFAGHGRLDGALREFMVWPTELLHPLPDTLSDPDGAMLEPLGVALHAFDLGHLRVGGSAAVVGCGPIGLLLVQLARAAAAATVVAVEPLRHRRDLAAAFGADRVVDPANPTGAGGTDATAGGTDATAGGTDATAGGTDATAGGVDVAFEVAGNDAAVEIALSALRPGGRLVLVGIPDDDRTSFPASLARRKGVTIALSRRMNEVYPRAIHLVEQKRVDVSTLVTDRYPLERIDEAFRAGVQRRGVKVVVEPAGGPGPDRAVRRGTTGDGGAWTAENFQR